MSENPESESFVKSKVNTYTMEKEQCHKCIVSDKVIDPNKDDYIRKELEGKLVFFHTICYHKFKQTYVKKK